ncbi:elongation factor Ts, mitochondrial-like [Ruditapes philippinarum]|uniref:elongation factor Ts, mitochondrial-like n=1 Tax=Ruditapes philippinarum TaxID=129788 RepID=UPI00295B36C1|nr:elongation factor Ts, mitochondrial-like [Ruditapes philippinarum]
MLSGLTRLRGWASGVQAVRLLTAQADTKVAVDKSLLSKLRKKTGYPMINCKQALEQFNNDIKQAEAWMREEAQKAGWAKAGKLGDRPMSQGLVGMIQDDSSVTIVEVNCETDFVAKNEKFQALVTQIAEACHKNMTTRNEDKMLLEKESLNSLKDGEKTLADYVALEIGNLGENIALRRAAFVRNDPSTVMSTFVHVAGPEISKDRCKMGKFAAIVKVEVPDTENIAKELCQHVVGMNPTEIGEWDVKPVDKKEAKKKKKENVEAISNERPEPVEVKTLLDQEFLLESGVNVRQYLQDSGPKVLDFIRIECGEELGEDD